MQKYLVCKRSEIAKINQWFRQCEAEKKPYVRVENRTKYSNVKFDHISLPMEYDSLITNIGREIQEKSIEIFMRYSIKKSSYMTNALLIEFEDLPIETAESAAEELYDLIADLLPVHTL